MAEITKEHIMGNDKMNKQQARDAAKTAFQIRMEKAAAYYSEAMELGGGCYRPTNGREPRISWMLADFAQLEVDAVMAAKAEPVPSDLKSVLLEIVCNYPKAVKQIKKMENITAAHYGLAYGVTPALFVSHGNDGVQDRVRLQEKADPATADSTATWQGVDADGFLNELRREERERREELEVVAAALYLGHDDAKEQFDMYKAVYLGDVENENTTAD